MLTYINFVDAIITMQYEIIRPYNRVLLVAEMKNSENWKTKKSPRNKNRHKMWFFPQR